MLDVSLYDERTILALKFVCGEVNNICRLCLSPTQNNKIKLDNTVDFEKEYCNNTISYHSMLSNLNVQNESELPQILCENCAEITINCYLFQKLSQYSNNKWLQALQLLGNTLFKLDTVKSETKSAFVILNSSENLVLQCNKSYNEQTENTDVLVEFQKSCQRYKQSIEKFICNKCKVQFDSQCFLNKHMRKQHQKSKKYLFCRTCDLKFRKINLFHNHIRIYHQKCKQQKYICEYCNKFYKRKDGLRSHIKIAHGFGDVLACNWCYKGFDAVSRLRSHFVKHTKEKNFECNNCERQFASNTALIYHKRLHTGEKPYACDLCDRSFLSASRRLEHKKRIHIGPQKECTLCEKKFVTAFQLSRHFYRHFDPASKLFITKECFKELKRGEKVK